MKANDLRNKSAEELNKELEALYREKFNLKMQKGTGHMPKGHLFSKVKLDIARIKTILKEKSV